MQPVPQCDDGNVKLSKPLDRLVAGVDARLPDLPGKLQFSTKNIFSSFLGHHVRGSTPVVGLALSSVSIASLVGIQAVVGCGEVVLSQDHLLEAGRHTVSRSQNVTGRDENSSTAPGNILSSQTSQIRELTFLGQNI